MPTEQEATQLIGKIKVVDIQDMEDGTCKIIFDYDQKFKNEYKRLFGLNRFSKKHFRQQLDIAIANFAQQVKTDKAILDLKQEILNLKED